MPALDGLTLQAEPALKDRNLPVIFLTGHGDIPMSVAAMKQGATDFLTKPVDDEVLLEAVRRALATDREQLQELKINAIAAERIATLTPRELEVLRWVIGGAMNKQIAARLGIAEKTVKIHRGRIVEKTGARAVPMLVDLCRRAGIEPLPGALSR
jgi:FixJ family two-component response regulator